ncbi:hypothetical protein EW145_g4316 [Phellinidium pouzarii]|uniref:Lysosomal dipeptide transporter MFSD1 n=1 Tax=Phellinidium pouzarii TaxID=167371 RepID=A0A4S4L5E4_9AGAM|nr:hypothetical protein EW145_g4316 [Phellinidium pouzarii]
MNLVYLSVSKWLVRSSGTELEASEMHREARHVGIESVTETQALKQVAEKRLVRIKDATKLGDVFWAYIGINILCGAIWSPFTHLAANIFEKRYDLSEHDAASDASFLLAASVFLYPICGYLIDRMKHRSILHQLFLLSSTLTAFCYFWLLLPANITKTPVPAVALFGLGQGFAPLVLVIIVPTLVSSRYIPTTLGAHKSLEQTGSTIFQTFAGLFLDKVKTKIQAESSPSELNLKRKRQAAGAVQCRPLETNDDTENEFEANPLVMSRTHRRSSSRPELCAAEVHSLQRRENLSSIGSPVVPFEDESTILYEEEEEPLLNDEPLVRHPQAEGLAIGEAQTKIEHMRGKIFAVLSICLIAFTWVFFIATVYLRLRAKKDREP